MSSKSTRFSFRINGFFFRFGLICLALLTGLFFVQLWQDIAGFTVRLEDVISLLFIGNLITVVLLRGKLVYVRSKLNPPIILWAMMFGMGMLVTLLAPFDADVKKDALVNGIRLILALSLFFIVLNFSIADATKMRIILGTIIVVSFLTTAVALLQMAHWAGVLPLNLPSLLTKLQEGANSEQGREIFALYIGNTGAHTWSGMLAIQAIIVWFSAWYTRNIVKRVFILSYFCLLVIILVRISVRNSILGLFISLSIMFFINSVHSRYATNRLIKPALILLFGFTLLVLLFVFGSEYYFTQRILQTLPQLDGGSIYISGGSNIFGRLRYLDTAIAIFKVSPIWGGGFYSFESLSEIHGGVPIIHAHNSYFQTMAELGLAGLMALMWIFWRIGIYLTATRSCLVIGKQEALMWQITAATFIFLLFTGLFSNTLWSPAYTGVFILLLGCLASVVHERSSQ